MNKHISKFNLKKSSNDLLEKTIDIEMLQNKLKEANHKADILEYLILWMPGNLYWKDINGKVLGCNINMAKIAGYQSPEELVGKTDYDLFTEKDISSTTEKTNQEIIKTGLEKTIEETGIDINDKKAIYLSRKAPLRDKNNNIIGTYGISFDITDRKQMEEELKAAKEAAEASDRAKSQFLAVMNHELRTPVASMIGLLDLLDNSTNDTNQRIDIHRKLRSCSEHLLGLVNNVLNFSRLESGKYEANFSSISLRDLCGDIKNIVQSLADRKKLNFEVKISENTPQHIYSDPMLLRQILVNLVNNALKFTHQGSVTVEIKANNITSSQAELTIAIIDTGIGIPEHKIQEIFDPFAQVEDAYTRQSSQQGTGLGLSIVRKMANLINAYIEVISEPNKGSTFTIHGIFKLLPHENYSTSTVIRPIQQGESQQEIIGKGINDNLPIYPHVLSQKPRILIIEDDPVVRYIHDRMVKDLGCEVDLAACGKEGLAKLDNHHFVAVDVTLPDISGFDVITEIRKQSKYATLPILALTAFSGDTEKNRCLAAGANEFITKPITNTTLRNILLKYLNANSR